MTKPSTDLNKVVLEPGAPKLAVGVHGDTGGPLPLQRVQDGPVLHGAQFVPVQLSCLESAPGFLHFGRPQQAPHVVGAVRFRHYCPPHVDGCVQRRGE